MSAFFLSDQLFYVNFLMGGLVAIQFFSVIAFQKIFKLSSKNP
jgi:hypothetical protein